MAEGCSWVYSLRHTSGLPEPGPGMFRQGKVLMEAQKLLLGEEKSGEMGTTGEEELDNICYDFWKDKRETMEALCRAPGRSVKCT